MTIVGQPASYSDMLKRIFAATLVVGLACTFLLARYSSAFSAFLDSWDAEASIELVEGLKAWYVSLPTIVALFARVFRLHNRISDLFRIRQHFDLTHILKPLMTGVGLPTDGEVWDRVAARRNTAMTRSFYRYAGFSDPKIDVQLVRTAADQWAWFWSLLEPQVVLGLSAITLALLGAWRAAFWLLLALIAANAMAATIWPSLRRGAHVQVEEILRSEEWKREVRAALEQVADQAA